MEILSDVVNYLLSLGAAIFVPIIIIIAGLIVRMKLKDAISAGITLGVAFTGMTMLINFMTGAISPAAEAMLKNTGISLPIVDGGWTTMSTISWSWPYAFLMFPLMIVINIIMLVIKKTNTFNADLWNVWGKIFTAVGVVAITGSVPLAFLVAAIQIVFELKTADVHQRRIEELSGIPGVTCTHKMVLSPISEAVSDFMNKKFKGRTLLVGLDWPFLGGSNEIWLAVIWSVPVTLICAMLLPGNAILPFAGIINIALAVPAYLVTKGNLPRMLILCTLGVPAFLWVGTAFAPFITDLANTTGAVALKAGEMISNSSIDGPVFTYAISQVFDVINGNWIPIIVLFVWVTCYAFYYRALSKENKLAEAKDGNAKAAGE